LLSRQSSHLLTMQFRSMEGAHAEISSSDVIAKLTDWWKNKSISESAWKDWASNVQVGWVAARKHGA